MLAPSVVVPSDTCSLNGPPHTYTRRAGLVCCVASAIAWVIVASGEARVPGLASAPLLETKTPYVSVTRQGSSFGSSVGLHATH